MISIDVKANAKQKEIKNWWLYLINFYKNPAIQCKIGVYVFHLVFFGIPSSLVLSVKNREMGGFT